MFPWASNNSFAYSWAKRDESHVTFPWCFLIKFWVHPEQFCRWRANWTNYKNNKRCHSKPTDVAAADWWNPPRMIFHVMTFSRLSFYYVTNSRSKKKSRWSANFVRLNVFSKEKKKGFANFDFDSTILNANFLYVRLVFLFPMPPRGERYWGVNRPPP